MPYAVSTLCAVVAAAAYLFVAAPAASDPPAGDREPAQMERLVVAVPDFLLVVPGAEGEHHLNLAVEVRLDRTWEAAAPLSAVVAHAAWAVAEREPALVREGSRERLAAAVLAAALRTEPDAGIASLTLQRRAAD